MDPDIKKEELDIETSEEKTVDNTNEQEVIDNIEIEQDDPINVDIPLENINDLTEEECAILFVKIEVAIDKCEMDLDEFGDVEKYELAREEINKNYDEENDLTFSHELTDRLLLQTVSVNGITDRKFVENYIFSMNVKDAASYRKYIIEHEPGVDFNIEVQRPESLGGGSIKSFLRLDQFIFINV